MVYVFHRNNYLDIFDITTIGMPHKNKSYKFCKRVIALLFLIIVNLNHSHAISRSTSLEEIFLNPQQCHKPLIIWQWMDGLVTKEGITKDLEAFKAAGLAGVHNFQIGGPQQMRIGNPENAIGSENWKSLLRWTLDECERLGLTFGTHNCPGWSSSAYVDVKPEYSMKELVYTDTPYTGKSRKIMLPAPEVDPRWNYYEDVAVIAVPADSTATFNEIVDLTSYFDPLKGELVLPKGKKLRAGSILRIGQTTNGKTNEAQSPESGRGLECDKLSKEAVVEFWKGYPSMLIETAGKHIGKTFVNIEIDSYEAGGQVWSKNLPEEFMSRAGYDLLPFLPYMVGRLKIVNDEETTSKFLKDWEETIKQCVAENYYGYMSQLAKESGLTLMIEPYGTGGQRPFRIIDFKKIANAAPDALLATEFWQAPGWGWKDMGRHETYVRELGRKLLIAEAFTCWPLRAWSDSPETLKPMCDKAFCTGVNRMMLHAGATNPWPNMQPGMSFGIWGTQFVPGQTWWKAGGAKELFEYMGRCQALLQQGIPAKEQLPRMKSFQTYRRTDGDVDIIFVCNPTDTAASERLNYDPAGKHLEIWNPYTKEMNSLTPGKPINLTIEPFGSRFIIAGTGSQDKLPEKELRIVERLSLEGKWDINFDEIGSISIDSLSSWHENANPDIRYYSGTAIYTKSFTIPANMMPSKGERLILSLGEVKNMASVRLNGKELSLLWKSPFECDVTEAIKDGINNIEISVTNLWVNRMIGEREIIKKHAQK